jgi:hypothetical protein
MEKAAPMLSAFETWAADQAALDEQTGYASVAAAEDLALQTYLATYRELRKAGLSVLAAPANNSAAEAVKREIFEEHFADGDHVDDVFEALTAAAASPVPDTTEWNALEAAYDAAHMAMLAARAASDEAWAALEAQAPWPKELADKDGGVLSHEGLITRHRDLTFEEKTEKLEIFRAFLPVRDTLQASLRVDELSEAAEAAEDALAEPAAAFLSYNAPNLKALARQTAVRIAVHASLDEDGGEVDPDDPEHISQVLSCRPYTPDGQLVRTYQSILSLAGLKPEIVATKAFNPERWIDQFEAFPGHTLEVLPGIIRNSLGIRAEYADPVAWGPSMPAHKDIVIQDPEALARYDAWVRSRYTDAQWAEHEADPTRYVRGDRPFVVGAIDHIEQAYPDGGPEHDRLVTLHEMRCAKARGELKPIGSHLWAELEPWRRQRVASFVKANPARFPENRDWRAADWIEAYEGVGGALWLNDGVVFFGGPVPATSQQQRLLNVCKDGLRYQVVEAVKDRAAARAAAVIDEGERLGGRWVVGNIGDGPEAIFQPGNLDNATVADIGDQLRQPGVSEAALVMLSARLSA